MLAGGFATAPGLESEALCARAVGPTRARRRNARAMCGVAVCEKVIPKHTLICRTRSALSGSSFHRRSRTLPLRRLLNACILWSLRDWCSWDWCCSSSPSRGSGTSCAEPRSVTSVRWTTRRLRWSPARRSASSFRSRAGRRCAPATRSRSSRTGMRSIRDSGRICVKHARPSRFSSISAGPVAWPTSSRPFWWSVRGPG
jgi:hypothetical protein